MATSTTKTDATTDRKAFVTLRFAGDDLDPAEISAILPIEPTRAHRKGEEFYVGPHAGTLRGRTGIWFLATDKHVASDNFGDHVAFIERLLCPTSGANRIEKLRRALQHSRSHAHITCFWRGECGEALTQIPARLKRAVASLPAVIETDFATADL